MGDEILFMDEDNSATNIAGKHDKNWKVLIVDDEREIHMVTTHVLKDFSFKNRGIDFFHAYSGKEAMSVLSQTPDIALIFLDVVMETDDAGLRFIEWVRKEVKNRFVRIVLRTGQPGLAPEKSVIINYDIDDYRSKTELTAVRLFTTTVAALRAYTIMMDQEDNRNALESLVKTSWSIGAIRNTSMVLEGIMPQIVSFMALGENSFFAEIKKIDGKTTLPIIMGRGRFQDIGKDVSLELNIHEHEIIDKALVDGHHIFEEQVVVGIVLHSDKENSRILFIESSDRIKSQDISVLKIFLASLDSAYKNMLLSYEVEEAHISQITMQKKLLDRLNNVIALRSKETAGHVRRVAECSVLLAEYSECDSNYIELMLIASPMHDIGKVGVPDSILLKPGKLTDDERVIINTHAAIGRDMFKGDDTPLINMARDIAGSHHEKWNGTGYPDGIKGDNIPLSGRITSICDVFDALLSVRPYKDALPVEKVIPILKDGHGTDFDPNLLDLFLEHIDEMVNIFNKYE